MKMKFLALASITNAFYLPGVAPKDYQEGEKVPLLVNALTAKDSLLPFDYYNSDLNFCKPENAESQRESLGSILFGDRLFSSSFKLSALVNDTCVKLCDSANTKDQNMFIKERILEEYSFNWIIDGLPAAELYIDRSTGEVFYNAGIPLGEVLSDKMYLHNHYSFHIKYHPRPNNRIRVVGIVVVAYSLSPESQKNKCESTNQKELEITGEASTISYTYNVKWEQDSRQWGTRWDNYLHVYDPQIHWFSIVNSIVIVLILASMVTMILLRTLHKDIVRYNSLDEEDGAQDEFGWKMVHADVFRPPKFRMLLSVMLGTGAQLFCMISVTICIFY